MLPDTDQQMSIVLVIPVHGPVHGRFQTVDRKGVVFKVVHALEMLDDSFELVVSCNDGFGVDGRYRLEGKENGLLSQRATDGLATILKISNMRFVCLDSLFSRTDNVLTCLGNDHTILAFELGFADLDISARCRMDDCRQECLTMTS